MTLSVIISINILSSEASGAVGVGETKPPLSATVLRLQEDVDVAVTQTANHPQVKSLSERADDNDDHNACLSACAGQAGERRR